MQILERSRLETAKKAFSTRRVPLSAIRALEMEPDRLEAGDLVLARITELGTHRKIELPNGRRAGLFVGDEVIVAFGNRYAADQFEAYVPEKLMPCHLAAGGGIASHVQTWHQSLSGPTQIQPLGLLCDGAGVAINVRDFALPAQPTPWAATVVCVFGTSMNAGKTTTAASLVRGLSQSGLRTGAAKVTGTGAGSDLWAMLDHGAEAAFDFTDAGFATTFLADNEEIIGGAETMVRALSGAGMSVIVLEVADGLFQRETLALADSPRFKSLISGTIFAAGDAMGGVHGALKLQEMGHNVLGLSGLLSASPLASREASEATGLPVMTAEALCSPAGARTLLPSLGTLERLAV